MEERTGYRAGGLEPGPRTFMLGPKPKILIKPPLEGIWTQNIRALDGGVLILHVDFKEAYCRPVEFKNWSCRPVEFKK